MNDFWRNPRRHAGVVVLAAITAAALAACSPSSQAIPEIDYQPGELSGIDPSFDENMAGCLRDAGFDVFVPEDGGVQVSLPEDQQDVYMAASDACQAQFGYDQETAQTDEQKRSLYRGLLALSGCLEGEGYGIENVPSEQAYLDGATFDPYGEVLIPLESAPSNEEYARLLDKCPMP